MITLHALGSAGDAASYYARDNYYTADSALETSAWAGKGAEALGLTGPVAAAAFRAVLEGQLPDGSAIAARHGKHRPGLDLTLSAPKSVSLIGLVGGDSRVVEAVRAAATATLAFVESELIEARAVNAPGTPQQPVRTGNLLAATFLHDVNRAQEPQLHVHAVIANATQRANGEWRALCNEALYRAQHLLGTVHNTELRARLESLGYRTELTPGGRDGAFELAGVPRAAIAAFSQRSQAIAAYLREHGLQGTPREREIAALATRDPKAAGLAPEERLAHWRQLARRTGLDAGRLVAEAQARSQCGETVWTRVVQGLRTAREQGAALAARMGLTPRDGDPLVPERAGRLAPTAYAAAQAVASAVRELGQREAAFSRHDLLRTALTYGGPASVADVAARIALLQDKGLLTGDAEALLTTQGALAAERAVLGLMAAGKGQAAPLMAESEARANAQETARELGLRRLNPAQERAAALLLSSRDRIVAVQGVSGAGKSAVLRPVAALGQQAGRPVLGLAVAGVIAAKLREDVGGAETLARFLARHERVRTGTASPAQLDRAKAELGGGTLLLDEASQVGTAQMRALIETANALGVAQLALIGDKRQLGAIDAGKPFAQGQEERQGTSLATALLPENLRARSPTMKAVAAALNAGQVDQAFAQLKPHTYEVPRSVIVQEAVKQWAALPRAEREATLLLASGRQLRGEANRAAQAMLKAEGALTGRPLALTMLERVSLTREAARQHTAYLPGRVVELRTDLPSQRLQRGMQGTVEEVKQGRVRLKLADGSERTLIPQKLPPNLKADALSLYERRELAIHQGERIRWTQNDPAREFLNAGQARVEAIDRTGVTVACAATGAVHLLKHGDPMLARLDLAYALNTHAAQGVTSEHGIVMLSSTERNLASTQGFLVALTRIADKATLVTDNAAALERVVTRNSGEKTAALEAAGEGGGRVGGEPGSASDPARPSARDLGTLSTRKWLGPAPTRDLPFPEKDISLEL